MSDFRKNAIKWEDIRGSLRVWLGDHAAGWIDTIEPELRRMRDQCADEVDLPIFGQIKEKFGDLRLYTDRCRPEDRNVLDQIEARCDQVCMSCGNTAAKQMMGGWVVRMCSHCFGAERDRRLAMSLDYGDELHRTDLAALYPELLPKGVTEFFLGDLEGWRAPILRLFERIQQECQDDDIRISKISQRDGGLDFKYVDRPAPADIEAAAVALSKRTCVQCGHHGDRVGGRHAAMCLCSACLVRHLERAR